MATTLTVAGGANVTLQTAANAFTISGLPAFSAGVSTAGNTAGSTGMSGSQMVLVGTNGVSLSQSTGPSGLTVSLSGNATTPSFSGGVSTAGNTAGSTGVSGTRMVLVGSREISLSQSTDANGVTITVFNPDNLTSYNAYPGHEQISMARGNGTLHMQPYPVLQGMQFDRVVMPLDFSGASNSTLTVSCSFRMGIYTKNASTLSLSTSTSTLLTINNTGTASSNSHHGRRLMTIPMTHTMTQGNYYLGVISSSATAGANATLNQMVISEVASNHSGIMGDASNASAQMTLGMGEFSVTTAAVPASVGFAELRGTASGVRRHPIVYFHSTTV